MDHKIFARRGKKKRSRLLQVQVTTIHAKNWDQNRPPKRAWKIPSREPNELSIRAATPVTRLSVLLRELSSKILLSQKGLRDRAWQRESTRYPEFQEEESGKNAD